MKEIDGIIIVTNAFFYNQFVLWKSKLTSQKPSNLSFKIYHVEIFATNIEA